ncbi:MAG: type IV secretory system conjugative DNA transfer family protein [Candidatus Gracilibacteria bacterium]|nr:type IV secretory system conjugative DNA transfer family protein [Candidatus Gracilibacteria bacterium]
MQIYNVFMSSLLDANKTIEKQTAATETAQTSGGILNGVIGDVLYIILGIVLTILLLVLIVKTMRLMFEMWTAKKLVYMKITLPKADSKLDKERETKKDFKEKIGIMSMFYKAVNKLSEAGLYDTVMNLLFNHAKVSMELVYDMGKVHFYVSTYEQYANLVQQHITSLYNDAEVEFVEEGEFKLKPNGYTTRAASLGKENDDVFPIRTYKYMEDDGLNNFTNVFGGLAKDDKAVFQIVIKPAPGSWAKKAKRAAGLVAKGEYSKKRNIPFLDIFWNPIVAIFQGPDSMVKDPNNAPGANSGDSYKIFNQAEVEAQKIMGESAGQLSFRTSIRIICSSKSSRNAEEGVHAIIGAATIYADEYNNSLDNPQLIEDALPFIFTPIRYFAYKYRLLGMFQNISIFSIDELSSMYHFPDINYNRSPIIEWLEYKKLAPPHNLKQPKKPIILEKKDKNGNMKKVHMELGGFKTYEDGVLMGWNEYRSRKTPIYFDKKDRGRHHYVIGKSGGGKSVFVGYLARQDVRAGHGLGVIDPHGDLVEDILAFTPKERAKDVIVFDPADDDRPMGLNMLEVISSESEARKREMDRAAMDATEIFIKIFGDEIFGPRIQHYFRNGCLTLMEDLDEGGTLIDVPRLFTDDAFMKYKTSKVQNPVVKSFWDHEYANTGDREKQEMIPYFSSKFGPFITNTTIRNIIGQPKSAFNIRHAMDNEKIVLVNLSKGKIGALNAQLLGLIYVSKMNMAAMSRADIPEDERKDFYLYVDEFQNFATETFGEILSEARKYRLALIMAHQFIAQINASGAQKGDKPSIKDAVFGNAGTIMSFKVGAEDAEYLEKEYAPVLSQQDIIGIANFTTYCKLNINNASSRPFDIKTIRDNNYKNTKAAGILKEYSRKKYGRKRKYVDMEIEARLGITN